MENEQPNYYAIIPANVRYDKRLKANEKLLYGEITSLCNKDGFCWAENEYFANLYQVSKTSISVWISNLIKCGYITSEIIYKEGTKEILNRYLRIVKDPIKENLNTPIKENLKDNNKEINNKVNKESKKEKTYDEILEQITNEDVKNTFYEFIKMRKLIKKPMTSFALQKMINKLRKIADSPEKAVAILEQSILNSWQGIFELKENKRTTQAFQGRKYTQEETEALFDDIDAIGL